MGTGGANNAGAGWAALSTKLMFFSGLAGVGYEAGFRESTRTALLLMYGCMMGLAKLGDLIQILLKGIHIDVGRQKDLENGGSTP